ncbi:MAG: hypothetical protein AAGI09_09865 [Pseudomonadota bacterium]
MTIWSHRAVMEDWFETRVMHLPPLAETTEQIALLGLRFACHKTLSLSRERQASTLNLHMVPRPKGERPVFVMTILGVGVPNALVALGKSVAAIAWPSSRPRRLFSI